MLWLPVAVKTGEYNNFIDALFTATSAVCVTGLVTVDTGTFYSPLGHVVIILLIQIGGLGIITATTLYALILGKRIGLKERILIKEALNRDELGGVVRLVRQVLTTTLIIEGIGAIFLSIAMLDYFPPAKALWYGVFHAVSAFCNAGFDLFGQEYSPFCSLVPFQTNQAVLLIIAILIIIGGIGFPVIIECWRYRERKRLGIHTKIVLTTTATLLVTGLIFFFFSEGNATLAKLGWVDRLVNAFFLSVTPRTAGYTAVDLSKSMPETWLLLMFLMFVGASPAGTGGGIKTTTFATLFLAVWSRITNREDVSVFDRRLEWEAVNRALTITVLAASVVFCCIVLLMVFDSHDPFRLMFEAFSAFGTVGLTTGITPELSTGAKLVLIFLMYFGRLGPLTMAFAFMEKTRKQHIKYPRGHIIIG